MSKTFLDLTTDQTHALLQLVLDTEDRGASPADEGIGMLYEINDELPAVMKRSAKEAAKLARQLEAAGYLSSESQAKTKTVRIGKMVRHRPILRVYYRVTTLGFEAIAELRRQIALIDTVEAEAA